MILNYREPDVYSKVNRKQPRVPESIVDLYPLIIGTGKEDYVWKTMHKDIVVEAEATKFNLPDTTPDDEVISVKVLNGSVKVNATVALSTDSKMWEVTLDAALDETEDVTVSVEWGLANKNRHTLQRFTGYEAVAEFYGSEFDEENDKINNISFGAQLALKTGSRVVYVLQIDNSDTKSTKSLAEKYSAALEEYATEVAGEPFWRIQPVDADNNGEIGEVIAKFVHEMSSMENRAEKYYGINNHNVTDKMTPEAIAQSFESFIEKFTTNPNNYSAYRMQTFYPNTAVYTFGKTSGEEDMEVGGEFIAIALAGAEQALSKCSQSLTNSVIPAGIFKKLGGVKMKRVQKNDIAKYGVTILTQLTENGAITVRDSLSMDVSTEQVSDPCVTRAIDYGAKYIRAQLHPYIGKYNIDDELLAKITAAAATAYTTLIQRKIYKTAKVLEVYQNENDLTNVIVNSRVGVLYPLKTVDVNIVCD